MRGRSPLPLLPLLLVLAGAGLGAAVYGFGRSSGPRASERARQLATCALLQPGNPDSNSVLQLCLVSRYDWPTAEALQPYQELTRRYFSPPSAR